MDSRICWALAALLLMPAVSSAQPRLGKVKDRPAPPGQQEEIVGEGEPALLAVMRDLNETLRAEWMDLRAHQMQLLSSGNVRAGGRIQPRAFRWVPGDPRRASAQAGALTYLIDASEGLPSAGITPEQADLALSRAAGRWGEASCLQPAFERQSDLGVDPDLFDSVFGYGERGTFPTADVVFAGFLPDAFFDLAAPPSGDDVIALTVTFVFVDRQGNPTDLDRDGYLDAALSEIYFNDRFSWSTEGVPGPPWMVDLESVALHEFGHALGIGHVETPPAAVMTPVYEGIQRELQPLDLANLCSVWGRHGG